LPRSARGRRIRGLYDHRNDPRRGPRLTRGGHRRERIGSIMQTLQLYAIWIVLSIAALGTLLAWRLM